MPTLTLIALLLAPIPVADPTSPPTTEPAPIAAASAPAAARCATAGVPEMDAAAAGEASWAPAVAALRAATQEGCDDPWLTLNLARAERHLALATGEAEPACDAARSHRRVLERGEPTDALATTHAHLGVLDQLCGARRARDRAISGRQPAFACLALRTYFIVAAVNERAQPPLALDLDAERAPLEPLCATPASTPAAVSAAQPPAAPVPAPEPWTPGNWSLGGQLAGSFTFPLDEAPPAFEVGPHIGLVAEIIGEAGHLDPIRLRALIGYATGALSYRQTIDEYAYREGSWRWHTLTAGLGARWMITRKLDVTADLIGALLIDATQTIGDEALDATHLLEPAHAIARFGLGFSPGRVPILRIGIGATIDLTRRAELGDAGLTTTTVLFGFSYLHPLDRELPPMPRVRKK